MNPILGLERDLRSKLLDFNPCGLNLRQIQFRLGSILTDIWARHYTAIAPEEWLDHGSPDVKIKWSYRRSTYVSGEFYQPTCTIKLPSIGWMTRVQNPTIWEEIRFNIINIVCHEFVHVTQCITQFERYKSYNDIIPRITTGHMASYLSSQDEIEAWSYVAARETWKSYKGKKELIIRATKRLHDRRLLKSSDTILMYHNMFSNRNDPFAVTVWLDFLKWVRHYVMHFSIMKDNTWDTRVKV